MEKQVLDYDGFLNENHTATAWSASLNNTPGMGNATVAGTKAVPAFYVSDLGDKKERVQHDDSWMRPSGDYKNRNWLVPNYEMFQSERQSMTRFQIGEAVRCVNPNMRDCYGKMGKIVAFEDQTIRWEEFGSETHVGQTSRQYRCKPQDLDLLK